ncbi:MAG: Holliday junction branch migration protein RuvA, partial [Acidimicrobiales bacterium]
LAHLSPKGDHAAEALLEVGGVGYRVVLPAGVLSGREAGAEVALHVHTHVREDAIVLYGFSSREQRDCFEALIATHGVGPAVALAMLSVHSPAALRGAVAGGDVAALTLVPGVGLKTAQRLLVELASRLGPESGDTRVLIEMGRASERDDVRAALVALGYGAEEIRGALARLPGDGRPEDLVRLALRDLSTRRVG